MKMKMNAKTTGIVFLLACLFITLFIGQWFNLRSYSSAAYVADRDPILEGFREGATTKKHDEDDEDEPFTELNEQDMKGVASGAGETKKMDKKETMDKKEYMGDKKEGMKKNTEGFREGARTNPTQIQSGPKPNPGQIISASNGSRTTR